MPNKWTLHHGIHRGTIASRDSTSETFNSKQEALAAFRRQKAFYHSTGYVIWFAEIISPTGHKRYLESNSNYRR